MPRTNPFSMRWDDELMNDVRQLAAEDGRSLTQYIEHSMRKHVERVKQEKKRKKKE
jgi:predicted HicB family RNase H-like nuclease